MNKIPTLYIRNPQDMRLVTKEITPGCEWVLAGEGVATVKRDGTNVRATTRDGKLILKEKRRNPTREEKTQGAEPGYVPVDDYGPEDKHIRAAFEATDFSDWPDGSWSCEALGPKIQSGHESMVPYLYVFSGPDHLGIQFPSEDPRTFDDIRDYLKRTPIEGIVWHHPDGRMAKIKRRDFGLPWPVKHD